MYCIVINRKLKTTQKYLRFFLLVKSYITESRKLRMNLLDLNICMDCYESYFNCHSQEKNHLYCQVWFKLRIFFFLITCILSKSLCIELYCLTRPIIILNNRFFFIFSNRLISRLEQCSVSVSQIKCWNTCRRPPADKNSLLYNILWWLFYYIPNRRNMQVYDFLWVLN